WATGWSGQRAAPAAPQRAGAWRNGQPLGRARRRHRHHHHLCAGPAEPREATARVAEAAAAPRAGGDIDLKSHWLAIAALFFVASAWGATFTLIKSALARIAPEPFIVLRFLLAGAVLLILSLALRQLPRAAIAPGIILGLVLFGAYWGQTRGLLT